MKKFVIAAFLAVLLLSAAYAHSPSSISIKILDGVVEVFVTHPVSDPATHYIKLIAVSLNGTEVGRQEFTTQKPDGQAASFTVPGLKSKDVVSVYAVCSRFGDKRKDLTVE